MSYIKHHAIIVTSWKFEHILEAHQEAEQIFETDFGSLASEIMFGAINSQYSFFIAPDGSKEGWAESDKYDNARNEFLDWLQLSDKYCDYVEIMFGGDDDEEKIIRSNFSDSKELI